MERELIVHHDINQLVKGCILGCEKEQTKLYDKYYYLIFSICLKYLKNSAESEDLTQDIFIKLINKLGRFKGDSYPKLTTWIKILSRNHTIDYIRSKGSYKNVEILPDMISIDGFDPSIIDYDENKMSNDINHAISNLPKQYKLVFELYYFSKLSHEEIANKLNLHVGTSKSNLFKAKQKLAVALGEYNNNYN